MITAPAASAGLWRGRLANQTLDFSALCCLSVEKDIGVTRLAQGCLGRPLRSLANHDLGVLFADDNSHDAQQKRVAHERVERQIFTGRL